MASGKASEVIVVESSIICCTYIDVVGDVGTGGKGVWTILAAFFGVVAISTADDVATFEAAREFFIVANLSTR
jgi:hypothetical protein